MKKKAESSPSSEQREVDRSVPPLSQEALDQQMVAIAYNKVKERMLKGEATSQEYVHFLKLGSDTAKLENKKLELDIKLTEAKTEAIKAQQNADEQYARVLKAISIYSGKEDDEYGFE